MRGNENNVTIAEIVGRYLAAQSRPGANARLAEACGVSDAAVSRWANGKVIPELWRADTIAAAMGEAAPLVRAAIDYSHRLRHDAQESDDVEADGGLAEKVRQIDVTLERQERRIAELEGLLRELIQEMPRSRRRP